jgi:GTPase Era involved in 16S rRNA processing
MDWKTASSHYETQLTNVLSVYRYALDLAELPQTQVPANLIETLRQEEGPISRQLERLKKREFRIAVVGLEKAGKSTFINAWLECDLLPSKAARCTFTTTQIYSVVNDTDQKLVVQIKTEEQFSSLKESLKQSSADNAKLDLEVINENKITLAQVIKEGNLTLPFIRLEDIKKDLKKYVADERYAHSVLEARLYTSKLAQAEGIVFYDVPGLDSGLSKHVDEAQQMLSDCDAVILVQRFTNLREKELAIIQFTEEGDRNITVKDKLFVFLGRIDSLATPDALKKHIYEASQDWLRRAKLPGERIVSGSAGAYLVLKGLAEIETQKEIGSLSDIQEKLTKLTDISDLEILKKEVTGIPEIKHKIFQYIDTERVSILEARCEASIRIILDTSEEIRHFVSKRYSENPEEAKRQEEDNKQILFRVWWATEWEQIKADLQVFYDTSVVSKIPIFQGNEALRPDKSDISSKPPISPEAKSPALDDRYSIFKPVSPPSSANKSPSLDNEFIVFSKPSTFPANKFASLDKFRARYLAVVDAEMQKLMEKTLREKERIFAANSNPEFDRVKANFRWREALYPDVTKMLASIASQLAIELKKEAFELIEYMTRLLWGSKEVKSRLIDNSEEFFLFKIENSLNVLFLRFARPVAESLVRGPINSDTRNGVIDRLGIDIEIIDNYYSGSEPAFKVLGRLAKYGSALLFDPKLRQEILEVADVVDKITGVAAQMVTELVSRTRTDQESVMLEVVNDLNALEEYLKFAIFDAAGFEAYYYQELQGLVDQFRNKEPVWSGVVGNEWHRGNPSLLADLPDKLKSQESSLEVSERLRQLSVALKNFRR